MLKVIFDKPKNDEWVLAKARKYVDLAMDPSAEFDISNRFFYESMTPLIQRNYCVCGDTPNPEYTVGEMYACLHTFLCGTKRKASPISKLGADITTKIFDHLEIRSPGPNSVAWRSFNQKMLTNA